MEQQVRNEEKDRIYGEYRIAHGEEAKDEARKAVSREAMEKERSAAATMEKKPMEKKPMEKKPMENRVRKQLEEKVTTLLEGKVAARVEAGIRVRGGAVFHPSILIRVPNSADRPLWKPTLIGVGKMLDQESALEMHVLITEPRGEQWNHAYTIEADHPIVKLWPEKLVGPVLKALDFIEFVNLCVWKWGVTEEAAELTVLIVVEDKQKRQWDYVIEDIARLYADGGHYRRSELSKRQHFRSIRAAYREDKKRGAILTSLEAEKMKLLEKKESVDPVHLPNIPFVLRDGLIYYVDELNARERLCVPKLMEQKIFELAHDGYSHGGFHRTYERIVEAYYMRHLTRRLKRYILHCPQCQLNQTKRHLTYGSLEPILTPPLIFHTIYLNFILGLPCLEDGSNTMMSVTDISPKRQHPSTMSTQRSHSQQPPSASFYSLVAFRPRADSDSFETTAPPAYAPTSTPAARDHLPFSFGAEFELILRPRDGLVPDFDATTRDLRVFNYTLLKRIANLLSNAGMPANDYDPCEDDKPDYAKWNVMLDGSLSKKHMRDGFCMK